MRPSSISMVVVSFAAMSFSQSAFAATWTVGDGGDFADIQPAIDASLDGDVIEVGPGSYGPIDFSGKAITVASTDGAELTTIGAGGGGTAVLFANGEPSSSLLLGFTITGATASGVNVVLGSGPTIRSCIIEGNSGEDGGGANIWGPAIIRDTVFINNSAVYGGGLYLNNVSAVVENNSFLANTAASGGGVYINAGNLRASVISGNSVSGQGGGISASSGSVTNALITGNDGIYGGGLHVSSGTTFRMTNSTVAGNTAAGSFGSGGGIHINGGASGSLRNVIVTENSATDTGGIYSDGSNPGVFYSNVFGNAGGDYGGNAQNQTGVEGNISADPLFSQYFDYALTEGSPSIDSGDPARAYEDPDTSIADMGVYGGPEADWDAYVDTDSDGVNIADGDCDDLANWNYPGNGEICDGEDNNCDSEIDEGLNDDLDGDGFTICGGDCDDADAGAFPGNVELPDDGVDQDCDGVDETTSGCSTTGTNEATAYGALALLSLLALGRRRNS